MYAVTFFHLAKGDLPTVYQAVYCIASEWRDLCLFLGLTIMDEIEQDYHGVAKRCLERGLSVWLKQNYDYETHGQPSWRRLIEALSKGKIHCALAKKLAKEHPCACMCIFNICHCAYLYILYLYIKIINTVYSSCQEAFKT